MNTNSNTYTIIYSAVIVVLVAAILAMASVGLRPLQEANIKAETIRQMLSAGNLGDSKELSSAGNTSILKDYVKMINAAFIINSKGEKIQDLNMGKESIANIQIIDDKELKAVNKAIAENNTAEIKLPVYIYSKDSKFVTLIPIYGAGLWGPVWGYLALKEDLSTIIGAVFDHESETPGLGAKITDDPAFRAQFVGKDISLNSSPIFDIIKGGNKDHLKNAIDAITGATLTSNGLNAAINTWLKAYKPFLLKYANNLAAITNNTTTKEEK